MPDCRRKHECQVPGCGDTTHTERGHDKAKEKKAARLERYVLPIPAAVTSYRVARLLELAWDFPSPEVLEYVGRGLDLGFDLCFRGEVRDL